VVGFLLLHVMRENESAVTQDDSAALHARGIFRYAEESGEGVDQLMWRDYREWQEEELPHFEIGSRNNFEFIQSQIIRGKITESEVSDLYEKLEDGEEDDLDKSGNGGWVPYIGPRGGTGWRSVDSQDVVYDEDPPGSVAVDQLSSDERRDIRANFGERGKSADHLLYDEGSVVPIEDRNVGESFLYNTSRGWKEYTITEKRVGGPGPDLVVSDGSKYDTSITREEYEKATSRVYPIPDTVEDEVGSVQKGKRIHIEGWEEVAPHPDKSTTDATIQSVENNLVQLRGTTILFDDEYGPMVKWESVMEGEEYIHPEYGPITYTGETGDRGYNDYEFETGDGERVNVKFSDDGEELYMPVEVSLPEPEYHLDKFPDEERPEQIRDTLENILDGNKVGISQVTDTVNTAPGEDVDPIASYSSTSAHLSFNPDEMGEDNLQKRTKAYESGFLAGGDIQHVVCHEVAHALHAQMGTQPDEDDWREYPDQDFIEEQIGEYAASSPGELVAEVGALILQGHDIEQEMPEIYDMYLKYGGPEQEEVTSI